MRAFSAEILSELTPDPHALEVLITLSRESQDVMVRHGAATALARPRDDPEGFARAVCAVLEDARLRQRLGLEGRRTVERHYSWERIGESMLPLYGRLLPAAAVATEAAG